jgi:hypothetical protein
LSSLQWHIVPAGGMVAIESTVQEGAGCSSLDIADEIALAFIETNRPLAIYQISTD